MITCHHYSVPFSTTVPNALKGMSMLLSFAQVFWFYAPSEVPANARTAANGTAAAFLESPPENLLALSNHDSAQDKVAGRVDLPSIKEELKVRADGYVGFSGSPLLLPLLTMEASTCWSMAG